ncbi:MAG: hypothetical protein HC827_09630 [Cyanobacteria bacterium RM1_2_2]|nr:hypothetical protein [Cyanobacteria bacterium RM1_2_2]
MSYFDRVLGAAIFDLSGLPKDYYISAESADISWVQTIFQALGLQGLLTTSFQIDGFRHAVIHGAQCHAVIVRRTNCFVAILMRQSDAITSEDLADWANNFDLVTLASDPRFSST